MIVGLCIGFLLFAILVLIAAPEPGRWNVTGFVVLLIVLAGGGAAIGKLAEMAS